MMSTYGNLYFRRVPPFKENSNILQQFFSYFKEIKPLNHGSETSN